MLGTEQIPPEVEHEYGVWQDLYHSSGCVGHLGPQLLVAMVRRIGFGKVRDEAASAESVDWRQYPIGKTRVEARFMGQWMPGLFLGFVENGMIAVRLDDDTYVRECRPDMVRLAGIVDDEDAMPEGPSQAILDLLDKPASAVEPEEPAEPADEPAEEPAEPPEEVQAEEPAEEPAPPATAPTDIPSIQDWTAVRAATPVTVLRDGTTIDGTFVRARQDGNGNQYVTVAFAERGKRRTRELPADLVALMQ
jgi:hypothetical protein